jgi:hypothetical protein
MVGRPHASPAAWAADATLSPVPSDISRAARATAATDSSVGGEKEAPVLLDIAAGDVQATAGPAGARSAVACLTRGRAVPAVAAVTADAARPAAHSSGDPVAAKAAEAAVTALAGSAPAAAYTADGQIASE